MGYTYRGQRSAPTTQPANGGPRTVGRIVLARANPLGWMALTTVLACGVGDSDAVPNAAETHPSAAALGERDLDAYGRGTRAQIDLLRRAIRSGRTVAAALADSVAARAAGISIPQYHDVRNAVEAALKTQAALANRAARLDSLRIELLVLRVRAETPP